MGSQATIKVVGAGAPWGLILTVILACLKTMGHITWSWWWVFAPMWAPVGIFIAVFTMIALVAGAVTLYETITDRL